MEQLTIRDSLAKKMKNKSFLFLNMMLYKISPFGNIRHCQVFDKVNKLVMFPPLASCCLNSSLLSFKVILLKKKKNKLELSWGSVQAETVRLQLHV